MSGNAFNHRLSTLLAERAEMDYKVPREQLDKVAELLNECAGIGLAEAEAIAWGQQVELTGIEVERIAEVFGFHPELLGLVLNPNPPSREVIAHVLERVSENDLNDMACDICEDLGDRVDFLTESGGDVEQLEEVCFELLTHLRARTTEEMPESHSDGAFGDPKIEQLIDVVAGLKEDGRKRVLAYAYRELQVLVEAEAGAPIGNMEAYTLLRNALKPLSLAVCDLLARAPDGTLTANKVVEQLNLTSPRSLSQLERSLSAAVKELNGQGIDFSDPPLSVERGADGKRLTLSREALSAWRALLYAEESSKRSSTR